MPPTPPPNDPSSNVLVQQHGNSAFQTTFDVAAGGHLAYTISRPLLMSLVQSRIDFHAYSVALYIGRALNWSDKGRERLHKALQETENGLVNTLNRLLKFGFDVNGYSKSILAMDDGQCFAALCASLCECYTVDAAARIIFHLMKRYLEENPEEAALRTICLPSLKTVVSMVDRFCGLFATSGLGVMMEDYMSYDGQGMITGQCRPRSRNSKSPRSRGIVSADKVAEALYEVIQLSRDEIRKVQFVGGADAVAVAAVGVWLVDLPTAFYKSDEGALKKVLSTHGAEQEPRVVVLFSEQATDKTALVRGRVVCLPPLTNVIRDKGLNADNVVGGRLRWNKVLSGSFGVSFAKLMGMHSNFGPAMGCAARIFQGLAEGDEHLPEGWRAACRTYFRSSFGLDYVTFTLDRFPELRTKAMEESMREYARLTTCAEAQREFETSMAAIAECCRCKYCCFNGVPNTKRPGAADTDPNEPEGSYCLVALSGTIIRLARALSGIEVKRKNIFPDRKGVECFYNQQHQRLMQQRKGERNTVKDERFLYRILEYVKIDKSGPEYSPLAVANSIFSGKQLDKDIRPYTSAIACEGICCYYAILEQQGSRDAPAVAKVCIIAGCIEYRNQKHNGISDFGVIPFQDVAPVRKADRPQKCVPEKVQELARRCRGDGMHLVVEENLVEQRSPWLEVGFELRGEEGIISVLGPCKIVENITQGTGVVSCQYPRCEENSQIASHVATALPHGSPAAAFVELEWARSRIFVFRGDTTTAFVAAHGCWLPLFLDDQTCVTCAVRAGVKQSWPNFAVVCSPESHAKTSSSRTLLT